MNPLTIHAVGPVSLNALTALRPVPTVTNPATGAGDPNGTAVLGLAQGLFQRALQVTPVLPLAEPLATTGVTQTQEATASLLAALNAPQAPATATPAATGATTLTAATSPVANPAETVLGNLTATQDAFAAGSSLDFALQTALRFGAGVGPLAAPATANAGQGTGLVRDATEVLRIRNLQPQTGGPGPEAFTQPQFPLHRAIQSYQPLPANQNPGQVDLLV